VANKITERKTVIYRTTYRKLFINGVIVEGVDCVDVLNKGATDEDVAAIFEAGMKFRTEQILNILDEEEMQRNVDSK